MIKAEQRPAGVVRMFLRRAVFLEPDEKPAPAFPGGDVVQRQRFDDFSRTRPEERAAALIRVAALAVGEYRRSRRGGDPQAPAGGTLLSGVSSQKRSDK